MEKDGKQFHIIDFSDHMYHWFERFHFFNKYFFFEMRQKHLSYSDKSFALLNDKKLYMNRKILPHYLTEVSKHNLLVKKYELYEVNPIIYNKRVHNDILKDISIENWSEDEMNCVSASLILCKNN